MAEDIVIDAGKLSAGTLKKPQGDLESAIKKLKQLDDYGSLAMSTYSCNGEKKRLFSANYAEEVASIIDKLESIKYRMDQYAKLLGSAPEEFVAIDKSFKGTYSNIWQRITYLLGSAGVGRGVKGAYDQWFKKVSGATGEDTAIVGLDYFERKEIITEINSNPIYAQWGITNTEIEIIVNTSATKEDAMEAIKRSLKEKLDDAVKNNTKIDISEYPNTVYYDYYDTNGVFHKNGGNYEKTGGCTWYAFNRYKQVNGYGLSYRNGHGGNAQDWDDRIDTTLYDKTNTGQDVGFVTNAIGVDNEGALLDNRYYGHVVYVDAIIDGTVYMSEGWYEGGFIQTGMEKMSYSDFSKKYEVIITAKKPEQEGC